MEVGRIISHNNLETTALLENLGGCCEGTVFTFTSASSKWRIRQRFNRNRASLLNSHEVPILFRENPADSVFTEIRLMPRSTGANSSYDVDICNYNKRSTSDEIEGLSRGNNAIYHNIGDLRYCHRMGKLTPQLREDQAIKVIPQEVVTMDHEKNKSQVFKQETTPQKNRRYLRCGHLREGHKWNEKKLEEVRAQEEKRRNKRESCTKEIYICEQRKVKCRRKDQDSCSRLESMQGDDLCKARDVNQASCEFNCRQEIVAELKKQQLGHHLAINTYVPDESAKNPTRSFIEIVEKIEDNCLNHLPKQMPLQSPILIDKYGNTSKENGLCTTPQSEAVSPSTPPLACSFISFKAGVPSMQSKRYVNPLGSATLTPTNVSNMECGAVENHDRHETKSRNLSDNKQFFQKKSSCLDSHNLFGPSNTLQRSRELSSQSICPKMEGDNLLEMGRLEKLDAHYNSNSMEEEHEKCFLSQKTATQTSHLMSQEGYVHNKPKGTTQNLKYPTKITNLDTETDVVTGFDFRGPHNTNLEKSPNHISKSKHASFNEEESETQRINISHLHTQIVKEEPCDKFWSKPMDLDKSYDEEDELEMKNPDSNDLRSNDRDTDNRFSSRQGTNEPCSIQECVESCDDISECSLNAIQALEVKDCEPCDIPNQSIDDGNARIEDKVSNSIARDLLQSKTLELESQSSKDIMTNIHNEKSSISRPSTSMFKNFAKIVDGDQLTQKGLPLECKTWVKGFKRKTRERVGYFDYWLGRGKKDLSSRKPNKTSPRKECGLNGAGELSQAIELKMDDEQDKSHPLGNFIDQHLISQDWSKKETEENVTNEFKILDVVLQSEGLIDEDNHKAKAYSHRTRIKSNVLVGNVVDGMVERRLEHGTMTRQDNSQTLNNIATNTFGTNLEINAEPVQIKCIVGQDSTFHCREQELSHVTSLSNKNLGQARECNQTLEGREDPLTWKASSTKDGDVVHKRDSTKFQDVCNVISKEGFNNSLENSTNMEMFSQSQDTRHCSAHGPGIVEKCRFIFEKRCESQEDKLTRAEAKVLEGMMKPDIQLTVLNESRDIPTHKPFNRSDVAVEERDMRGNFGAMATKLSDLATYTCTSAMGTEQLHPSLTIGFGSCSKATDSLVQIEKVNLNPVNGAPTTFSQHASSPRQQSSIANISMHGEQVNRSSIEELRSPSNSRSSRVMVGYQGNGECNFSHSEHILDFRNGLIESKTTSNGVERERSFATLKSQIHSDKFPSSLAIPKGKEIIETERMKETSLNRRQKMPIIVRVRNRLARGWLLQHSLWKKIGKQKMKTCESQVFTTKSTNQKEIQVDPSSVSYGKGSTVNPLTTLPESKIEDVIECGATEMENFQLSPTGDLDPCKYYRGIEDSSKVDDVGEQNDFNRTLSPTVGNYEEVERDHLANHECLDQDNLVLSFSEWESRSKRFMNSSPTQKKLGANSVVLHTDNRVTKPQNSNEFKDVEELPSDNCLGHSSKEPTVLGTCSEFDPGDQDLIRDVCPSKREKTTAVSQKFNACSGNGSIIDSNSEAMKSGFCQREALSKGDPHKKKQTDIPMDYPANTSLDCCPGVGDEGADIEETQECESEQDFFALGDRNEDLQTCFSASFDDGYEGPSFILGRMRTPGHTADSIDGQPQVDGQSDDKYFTPEVEDLLDFVSIEPTLDESERPASQVRQPHRDKADEEQHRPLPNFVQPSGQSKVMDPFCLPLQVANFDGKELVLGDGPENGTEIEEHRRSGPEVTAMQEEDQPTSCLFCSLTDKSPRDLSHWELVEMLKIPNHQRQLWHGRKLEILSSKDNQEQAYRTGKQTNAWESSSQKDCGRTRGTLRRKDAPKNHSTSGVSTEEQVFLERFSATSNDLKPCKLPHQSAASHLGVQSLGRSCCPFSPDLGTQMRLLSAPARLNCGRTESISLSRNIEPALLPSDAHLINSLPPCTSTRLSLSEARRPDSSQEYKHERSNAFESRLLPDYAPSLDGFSPSSSISRSLSMSERLFTKACPCADCPKKYEHREAVCVQGGADGVHDWTSPETRECLPSMTMNGSTFPAQCQSLPLNPRQSFCPIHSSQSSTQCRCDPYNSCRYSPPFLQRCHHPSSIAAVQRPSQCHLPGHCLSLPASFNEPGMFQSTGAPYQHGPTVNYPKKDTVHPYSPLQVIQPSASPPPRLRSHGDSQPPLFPHERHCADKNSRATQNCQLGGQSKSNQTKGTESEKGLVWLSEQEMNLIQQLRLSSEKEAARVCRHDAAAIIQRNWRNYLKKKAEEEEKQEVASSLLTEYPTWHDHFQYSKLLPAAMSLQLSESSSKDLTLRNLVKRWYTTMQTAASVIQRAWRSILRNRKEALLTRREWPKDLKTFYDIIKSRLLTRGHSAPSFGLFAKSVKRIQAATEGARVRRRLKSHRLQTIVLEIKEIRMLLYEMSQEEKSTTTPFLFPQLCTQLQQKILQLHAALNGKQMEPRYLLRRCGATPMTTHSPRSTSPNSVYMVPSQKPLKLSLAKLSSGGAEARKLYCPLLTNPASPVSADQNFIQTQSFVPLMQGSKGNAIRLRNSSPDPPDSADRPDSAKLLQLYFLAQRSPSKSIGGRGTPDDDATSRHEPNFKVLETNEYPSQKRFSSPKASPKSKDLEYSFNKSFDEQPLPVPQRRKTPEMSLGEMVLGGGNANMYLTEYGPSTDLTDKPKRPFLKRKSIAMPSQKLDWSKVKPMVSSRLEPELKTKLSFCKGPSKEPTKVASKKKKANYSNVKSRLFSYEENVSPSNSGDGTYLRSHTSETPRDSGHPPMLRNSARGSSTDGSENDRFSRVPPNRQRTVSPDLMHLRRSMAEADRLSSQNSMLETRSVATYNSNFDSARYLHKLGHNSEQASQSKLTGSRQQRTQRSIRLRILPGSKESPVGDLFVQEEMQEIWEDQSHSPVDGKGKREQNHSHRYAIYQEEDGRYSSRVSESTRPLSAEEDRRVTATSSRKVAGSQIKLTPESSSHSTAILDGTNALRQLGTELTRSILKEEQYGILPLKQCVEHRDDSAAETTREKKTSHFEAQFPLDENDYDSFFRIYSEPGTKGVTLEPRYVQAPWRGHILANSKAFQHLDQYKI